MKETVAQKRILEILSDNKLHALIPELEAKGFTNQFPAIRVLENRGRIIKVVDGGYYSRWQINIVY